ncbi:MAG: HigA family addiction module antidote protein [Gammaproteobacteria bacterium]|nr:HigA family addiction module antidote protein [Gammaproteobacteria bacterium]
MRMQNPPHPGISVREDCLKPLNLSVTAAAEILGVSRQALNNVLNGAAGISAEMAVRLDKAFGGGAETWLALQMAHDLAAVRRNPGKIRVKRIRRSGSHRHATPSATTSASR